LLGLAPKHHGKAVGEAELLDVGNVALFLQDLAHAAKPEQPPANAASPG